MSKKVKLIVLVAIGGIALLFILLSRQSNSPQSEFKNEVPISQKENNFGYDDVLKAYENAKENGELDKQPTYKKSEQNNVSPQNQNDQNDLYSQEEDPRFKAMQEQIELMEQQNKTVGTSSTQNTHNNGSYPSTITAPQQSEEEKKLEYRKMLLEARNERILRSQDYSATNLGKQDNEELANGKENIEFRASVFRDQFIMPGDRVTLILTQPLTYKGNLFPKNTFLYATANIKQSRVLLDITNINHVSIELIAKDIRDGAEGLYNKRAGELWREYQADVQSEGVSDITNDVSTSVGVPLVGSAIKAFGSFFRKKQYKESDKILLIGNNELILTTPN